MTDEPENLTLKLLREMRAEIQERDERAHAEIENLALLVGSVADAVTAIASTQDHHTAVLTRHSEILEHHSELMGKLYEIQQNNGARLNAIDGRLAIIERHTGLVKA